MLALVTTPGATGTTAVALVPDAQPGSGEVLIRTLEVGVCGTDREISEGLFGVAPDGARCLVLGHELLGSVARPAYGFDEGDLVTATVRRSCRHCEACAAGAPDACWTGDYSERGITRLDGFASELVAESAQHLVRVPSELGRLGVLAEPASVCARALRHVQAVGDRQPWAPRRALVIGAGAIGMIATAFLRLDGLVVWTAGLAPAGGPVPALVEQLGAVYVPAAVTPLDALAHEVGGFDVVIEAAGDAQVMLSTVGLLARNGVACLLGIDGRPQHVSLDGRIIGVDAILQNRALLGSVNASPVDWVDGLDRLDRINRARPDVLAAFVGLRAAPEDFADALAFRGVKATLAFVAAPD